MKKISLLISFYATVLFAEKPNIVFILADDMGYGDVSHMGGKAATPHIDSLVENGMRFSDAHTTSAVCTPTRYGILTGRYNWRSRKKASVLSGTSAALIPPSRQTIAAYLSAQGYQTACIGKWHLGLNWTFMDKKDAPGYTNPKGYKYNKNKEQSASLIDYTKPITGGPTALGFDYYWGISASLDMDPYVYIKNDKVVDVPTTIKAFHRPGPAAENFEAEQCLIDFAGQSRAYIKEQAKTEEPFFLYLPLTSPHTPIVPSEKFKGKSPIGIYGDFIMETDWVVGEVLAELNAQGLTENTLIVFTADNGCSPQAKIPELIAQGHKPNADWRGHKADIYEGGHRVPFVVQWPGKVKPKSESDSTITTADFFNTVADILGAAVDNNTAEDSFSFLPDLLATGKTKRTTSIHHSINGSFAIRKEQWKLILCPGSGGWSAPRPSKKAWGAERIVQLYNLDTDPAEKNNLAEAHPERVSALVDQVAKEIKAGRSTEGEVVSNDGAIPFNATLLKKYPQLKN